MLSEFLFFSRISANVSTVIKTKYQPYLYLRRNVPNILVYAALEVCYVFNCAAHFVQADGRSVLAESFTKVAGSFGFLSALAGFYLLAHGLCQDTFPFKIPLCETYGLFRRAASSCKHIDETDCV